jgi:hypothetical protein
MEPIETWSGEPIILNVANGGAGLILIGQDGRAGAEIYVKSLFVLARSHQSVSSTGLVDGRQRFRPVKRNRQQSRQ